MPDACRRSLGDVIHPGQVQFSIQRYVTMALRSLALEELEWLVEFLRVSSKNPIRVDNATKLPMLVE
jgi:hypothetical protein